MSKIAVLLVDDHAVVRQGLRMLLEMEPDIEVVAEAENGRQAVALAREQRPSLVIIDVAMPLLNGIEATRQIVKEFPKTKVLVLTSYGDENCVNQMTRAGAAGFLVKQTAATDLLRAIREISRGNAFFSPFAARHLRDQCRATATSEESVGPAVKAELTSREAEVLQLIAEGFANKQIAAELGISIKTVEKHRQQVMNKLGIHDVAGLTRHAVFTGVIGRDMRPDISEQAVTPPTTAGPNPGTFTSLGTPEVSGHK